MNESTTGDIKDGRLKDIIQDLAAKFIQLETNGLSLITITNIQLADRGSRATIYFTVLPKDKEKAAQDFLKRKRAEFRQFVMSKSKARRIPFFDFEIDFGEHNRQRIDEISQNS